MSIMLSQRKNLDSDIMPSRNDIMKITVGNSINEIDLSGLSESEITELKKKHINIELDYKEKSDSATIEVGKLDRTLDLVTTHVGEATQAGISATVSHVETTSTGKTEFMVGNTDKAAIGKLSRSITGDNDNLIKLVIIIAITVIVVAFILGRR